MKVIKPLYSQSSVDSASENWCSSCGWTSHIRRAMKPKGKELEMDNK